MEKEKEKKSNLSAPWYIYVRKITALFGDDPEITIRYNPNKQTLRLFVANNKKAYALQRLLPNKKEFGNVTLIIEILPENDTEIDPMVLIANAFYNNPVISGYGKSEEGPFEAGYVIFKPEIVQFAADNTADVNGNISMLISDVAWDILPEYNGVFYCIDDIDNVNED